MTLIERIDAALAPGDSVAQELLLLVTRRELMEIRAALAPPAPSEAEALVERRGFPPRGHCPSGHPVTWLSDCIGVCGKCDVTYWHYHGAFVGEFGHKDLMGLAASLRTEVERLQWVIGRFERVTDYILDPKIKRLANIVLRNLATTARADARALDAGTTPAGEDART